MPRLIDDARALLEVDRERVRLAETAREINRETLATARDLAALAEQERPKALSFVAEMQAATVTPGAMRSSGGAGAGNGASGRAGAGGTSSSGPAIMSFRGDFRSEAWLDEHCPRESLEIPDPFNAGRTITIEVWNCSVAFGSEDAIFPVPESVSAAFPSRSSSSAGGGRRGAVNPFSRATQGRENVLGSTGTAPVNPFQPVTGGSSATSAPVAPTPGEKAIERAVTSGLREVVQELRATGDIGLQIRRSGL